MRNIIPNALPDAKPFTVHQHIILKNLWEYYLEAPDENGITFGFVMGFENEWGNVDLNEIKPYLLSVTTDDGLQDIMAPAGYRWEDEREE